MIISGKYVSKEDFIRAWQKSDSMPELCKRLGIRSSHASVIAYRLRKNGVNLKKFKDRGADWGKLKNLADSLST